MIFRAGMEPKYFVGSDGDVCLQHRALKTVELKLTLTVFGLVS